MGLVFRGAISPTSILFALLLVATQVCAATESAKVFELIDQRLEYMKQVALYKARAGTPVEDRYQESIVIEKAKKNAAKSGLAPSSIEDFFRVQIAAAKVIQYRHLADWSLSKTMPESPSRDLMTEIRPVLIRLGDEIVVAIRRYLETGNRFADEELAEFNRIVDVEKLEESDKKALFDSMRSITLAQ